ncbi:uncharacterized protein JN550_012567 [Neoarthrinium moseri]|uniref:uncharacterized protein n=1 Tax=Neoarthrinium moseri TaxID=1658444 RepID=UPI001FDC72BE|nr:uncharacterized protein JN550_012567 [Neoarthrinium moseri]KAI1858520.1 hypothetical protein JN550_012567 [Neoarthrinium moseri]
MASAAATQACDLLKAAFPGQVTTLADGPEYESKRDQPWSQTCWVPSTAFVALNSAGEVASALAIIKKTGCKFAIRSSGHNPNVGFSSVDDSGVVFDLRGLNEKTLDSDGVLHAGPGNTWGEVYQYLQGKGLSPTGGREVQVGLGGFLTGGGYPPFPSLHGTGPDNVKGFEIVLADGNIVEANASINESLWRAIKGGTSNFGIVTRFDIETHPLIKAQFTIDMYDPSDYMNINAATLSVQDEMEKDPKLNLFTNYNMGFVAVFQLYADCPTERPKAFEVLENLPSKINTPLPKTDGTVLSFVETLSKMGHVPFSLNRKIATLTTKLSQELYDDVYKLWQGISKKIPDGAMLHYTIQPLSTHAVQAGEHRGANMLGLKKIPQTCKRLTRWLIFVYLILTYLNFTGWVFTAEWPKDLEKGSAVVEAHEELLQGVEKMARDKGILLDYLCPSFAGASQKVMRSFGGPNLQRIQDIAANYDPDGVFQKLQNDGFLLRYA